MHPALAGPVGEGTAQGGGLHLLRGLLRVVARLRAVDDATAGELRRAGRALTGAAGALLAVRLGATTADLARVLVACVPWRAAASWATTTWCISETFALASKSSPGSVTLPEVSPAGVRTST